MKKIDVNKAGKDVKELADEVLDDAVERAVWNNHPPKSLEGLEHLNRII